MNRVEKILEETYKHHFRDLEYDELNLAAMEQTAIQFSKWKDENYEKQHGTSATYIHIKTNRLSIKSLYQLFNEWKNQTT